MDYGCAVNGEYRPMRSSSLTVTSFSEFRPVGRQLGSYTSVNNISGNRNSHWSGSIKSHRLSGSHEVTRASGANPGVGQRHQQS